ncbi:DUF2752 domain-containing protein [Flavobacterium arcticum]|uniref:DUF2752 domain-containing protein n=1 Tax=Flavobacterium arcticum TaxID=1784713 RepID=A0A345HDH3_9FLAO|nr:DUF2752 domain-containing protein [Flavobacterium arcticum]AXG74633.1 DUF2752 domain-containing protein [Flavobacterium arcticum]KAF2512240.1 DUF2752 domain-containing protein [Flavobacterium arcticum]
MNKKKLYLIITLGLIAGYSWLTYILLQDNPKHSSMSACFFKNITGVPCPSCGNTRSILSLIKGNFNNAIFINPLGFIVAGIMFIFPFWLLYDISLKKNTLHKSYLYFEKTIKIKPIAIVLIILLIANWIWNIQKGL